MIVRRYGRVFVIDLFAQLKHQEILIRNVTIRTGSQGDIYWTWDVYHATRLDRRTRQKFNHLTYMDTSWQIKDSPCWNSKKKRQNHWETRNRMHWRIEWISPFSDTKNHMSTLEKYVLRENKNRLQFVLGFSGFAFHWLPVAFRNPGFWTVHLWRCEYARRSNPECMAWTWYNFATCL